MDTKIRNFAPLPALPRRARPERQLLPPPGCDARPFVRWESGEGLLRFFGMPERCPGGSGAYTLPTAGKEALEVDNARKKSKDRISRDGGQDRTFSSGPPQSTADRLVSTTDPDATPFKPR